MTPDALALAVRTTLLDAVEDGDLTVEVPDEVRVERPRQREHGDWATNIALQVAKAAKLPPREVAVLVAGRLAALPGIARVDVAGPGFINVTLDAATSGDQARVIVLAGDAYGHTDAMAGVRVNLEFVSANPTGPIHLGGTRWAAVGDSLGRILSALGADVTREYYFNDHGAQIDRFSRSLLAAARGEPTPEDGYAGAYIHEIAADVVAVAASDGSPDPRTLPREEAQEVFRARGVDLMFTQIKQSLHDFGVDFDVYFHEASLHENGRVDQAIEILRASGRTYETDGALWLRTTEFGDDKDRVVVKSDGKAAYIAGDLAYYLDKRERGFERKIIMLGADHHGYIGRMMAMVAAFGDTPHVNLEMLIGQMVNLVKDGKPVRMSKRAGTVVTLEDLVDAVGKDAARYALARSSADSPMDVDLDVLTRHTNDNPVFYVQYAHARISGVSRNAPAAGVRREDGFDPSLLTHDTEAVLLAALGEYPRVVTTAGTLHEPHRVARYLEELAGHFHKWYDACRVIPQGDDPVTDLNRTRLWLNEATRVVLANGLALLGVSAPQRM